MTRVKTDYFKRLENDLIAGIVEYDTSGKEMTFTDYNSFVKYQKIVKDIIKPYFDKVIENYDSGLMTYEETFKMMMKVNYKFIEKINESV